MEYPYICPVQSRSNMRNKYGIFLGVIGLILFFFVEGWGADWKLIGLNEEYWYYLDKGNIHPLPDNVARVWTKSLFTEKSILKYMKIFGSHYIDLDHEMTLLELNCTKKMFRYSSVAHYSKGGGILGSSQKGDFEISDEWIFITPETGADFVYREVCKQP